MEDDFYEYEGGIFRSDSCWNSVNHGMLAVGYGEEDGKLLFLLISSYTFPSQVQSSGSLRTVGARTGERTGTSGWPGMRTCAGSPSRRDTPRWIAITDVS